MTVKATDQGEPSLEGVCSFTVEITDVNDNPPLFDRQVRIAHFLLLVRHLPFSSRSNNRDKFFPRQKYVENVKQDASAGTNILRVSASDEDADNNGAIMYSLSSPNNDQGLDYFEIQPESGWIVLKKPLDVSNFLYACYKINISPSSILHAKLLYTYKSVYLFITLSGIRFSLDKMVFIAYIKCWTKL